MLDWREHVQPVDSMAGSDNAARSRRGLVSPPQPLSRFIGRESEIRDLKGALAENRLVTLTGPGGCGKTRLAIELATELAVEYVDGIAFADLAPIADGRLVEESVAESLGLRPQPLKGVAEAIAGARLLLLIDNVEHLVDGLAPVAKRLLVACPGLRILLTSRVPLHIDGEVIWRVSGLALPPHSGSPGTSEPGRLAEYDAVKLFCLRASEQDAGFRLTPDNAGLVGEVCWRLDGMPLALELAAAWVGRLALAEIAARLEHGVSLLCDGYRTAGYRHQTLRSSIDWSYELLGRPAQRLLACLSIFVGTFDIQAIQSVCTGTDREEDSIPSIVKELVDNSLLQPHHVPGGALRYRLLEVVRQYASERLHQEGGGELALRHSAHYAKILEGEAEGTSFGLRAARIALEYANVRAALDWAGHNDPVLEVRMVTQLLWFWKLRGSMTEARDRISTILAKRQVLPGCEARLHVEAAAWARRAGDMAVALEHIQKAMRLRSQISDPRDVGWIVGQRGVLLAVSGEPAAAERDLQEALEILEPQPPSGELVATLNNLAMMRLLTGRTGEALKAVERAFQAQRELSDKPQMVKLLHTHGEVLLALGRAEEARSRFQSALEYAAEYDNLESAIPVLKGLASAFAHDGQPSLCLELLAAACLCTVKAGVEADRNSRESSVERNCRSALGAAAAEAAWSRGLRLDLPTALDRVRDAQVRPEPGLLTPRRAQIVKLVVAGLSNKEIAHHLGISTRTAESHLDRLRRELGLHNRQQLAVWAISRGIVPLPEATLDS